MNDCVRKTPRDYQKACIEIAERKKNGIFELTCGSGKSIIMLEIASKHKISVICVPTKGLAMQFCQSDVCGCLDGNLSGSAKNYVDKYFVFNSDRQSEDESRLRVFLKGKYKENDKILFIVNYQSLGQFLEYVAISKEDNKYTPIDIDVIMFDEGHLATGVARRNLSRRAAGLQEEDDMQFSPVSSINEIQKSNKNLKSFYFTATPNLKMLARPDIYGKVLFSLRYPEAIRLRNLTPFESILMKVGDNNEFTEKQQEKKYKNIIKTIKEKIKEHKLKRVIVYTSFAGATRESNRYVPLKTTVGNFEKYITRSDGISFKYFYADVSISDRVDTLSGWFDTRSDDVRVIIACRTISEGIDVKQCDGIFLFDQDKSVATTIQRAMRASRLPKRDANGNVWQKNEVSKVFIPIVDGRTSTNKTSVIQDIILDLVRSGESSIDIERQTNRLISDMTEEQIKEYISEKMNIEDNRHKPAIPKIPKFVFETGKKKKINIDWVSTMKEWADVNPGKIPIYNKDKVFTSSKGVKVNPGAFITDVRRKKHEGVRKEIEKIFKTILLQKKYM